MRHIGGLGAVQDLEFMSSFNYAKLRTQSPAKHQDLEFEGLGYTGVPLSGPVKVP